MVSGMSVQDKTNLTIVSKKMNSKVHTRILGTQILAYGDF